MIAEHSDRLYSTDVLVSIKPMAAYCLSSPQPRRNGATRAMTRVRTRPGDVPVIVEIGGAALLTLSL
jgi:hypothetical protein